MTREAHHRCGAAAPRPEIVDLAEAQPLEMKTERGETPSENLLAAVVVWCNRAARDELACQIDSGAAAPSVRPRFVVQKPDSRAGCRIQAAII